MKNQCKSIKSVKNSGRSQISATQHLSNSASQHLSFSASQLLSISALSSQFQSPERAWQKFLRAAMCPGLEKKFSCRALSGHGTHRSPPSTFLLLLPFVEKMAQIAGCCRKSFRRVLDQDLATSSIIPLTKSLISDSDPIEFIFVKFNPIPLRQLEIIGNR